MQWKIYTLTFTDTRLRYGAPVAVCLAEWVLGLAVVRVLVARLAGVRQAWALPRADLAGGQVTAVVLQGGRTVHWNRLVAMSTVFCLGLGKLVIFITYATCGVASMMWNSQLKDICSYIHIMSGNDIQAVVLQGCGTAYWKMFTV